MKKLKFDISSAGLHVLAMALMLCDHLWGTIVPVNDWLTCLGRISFPIFAFLIVEGYFHTSNLKKYVKRLLLFALLSEIPFNLAMGSSIIYPFHQNVLWTFLMAIGLIHWNERAASGKRWRRILVGVVSIPIAYLAGILTMADFYQAGVLTVLVFYFFRGRKWPNLVGQLIALAYINLEMLGGLVYEIPLWGETVVFHRQGFALLALIPIWLYRGKQGYHSKKWQYVCYAFYPVHLLLLGMLRIL